MSAQPSFFIETGEAAATKKAGSTLAGFFSGGEVVFVEGDLGTGKTTLVKGMADGLGIASPVTSPTFTLVHTYEAGEKISLIHVDGYRLTSTEEAFYLGIEDLLDPSVIVAVEWPRLFRDFLQADLEIVISIPDYLRPDCRKLVFKINSSHFAALAGELKKHAGIRFGKCYSGGRSSTDRR